MDGWKTRESSILGEVDPWVPGVGAVDMSYGETTIVLQGFIHLRWLALGFLNHQQDHFYSKGQKIKSHLEEVIWDLEVVLQPFKVIHR